MVYKETKQKEGEESKRDKRKHRQSKTILCRCFLVLSWSQVRVFYFSDVLFRTLVVFRE